MSIQEKLKFFTRGKGMQFGTQLLVCRPMWHIFQSVPKCGGLWVSEWAGVVSGTRANHKISRLIPGSSSFRADVSLDTSPPNCTWWLFYQCLNVPSDGQPWCPAWKSSLCEWASVECSGWSKEKCYASAEHLPKVYQTRCCKTSRYF